MEFKTFWLGMRPGAQRETFAACVGSTVGYLNLISQGHAKAGESLAINIERESSHKVTVEEIRPDVDWAVIRGKPSRSKRPVAQVAAPC